MQVTVTMRLYPSTRLPFGVPREIKRRAVCTILYYFDHVCSILVIWKLDHSLKLYVRFGEIRWHTVCFYSIWMQLGSLKFTRILYISCGQGFSRHMCRSSGNIEKKGSFDLFQAMIQPCAKLRSNSSTNIIEKLFSLTRAHFVTRQNFYPSNSNFTQ